MTGGAVRRAAVADGAGADRRPARAGRGHVTVGRRRGARRARARRPARRAVAARRPRRVADGGAGPSARRARRGPGRPGAAAAPHRHGRASAASSSRSGPGCSSRVRRPSCSPGSASTRRAGSWPRGRVRPLVVDLCTGSGAIALAVAREVPQAPGRRPRARPAGRSPGRDATSSGSGLRRGSTLRAGDVAGAADGVLADLAGRADVVVANPPYIPPGHGADRAGGPDHDPDVALYGGGEDGLAVPRAVVATAAVLLRAGGLLRDGARRRPGRGGPGSARAGWTLGRTRPTRWHDLAGRPTRRSVARRGVPRLLLVSYRFDCSDRARARARGLPGGGVGR